MQSTWGKKIKYSLFGESHGKGVGITLHGVPSGIFIDLDKINKVMKRRQTGSLLTSKRKEADKIIILSGEKDLYTTGNPLTFYIENNDNRSKDYSNIYDIPRPSHADFTQFCKYGNYADLRGGGHLSGRLTACILLAGTFIMNLKEMQNIKVSSHIARINNITDGNEYDFSILENLSDIDSEKIKDYEIPMINENSRIDAKKEILKAIEDGDSLGSKLKLSIKGLKAGIGEPFFYSLESNLAQVLFAIPSVKALEFGLGIKFAESKGSIANDEFIFDNDKIVTKTNNSAGINGGISNGMPINISLSLRPTPSIAMEQNTVNLKSKDNHKLKIQGRHDPCIGIRALPVIEAISMMAIYDLL